MTCPLRPFDALQALEKWVRTQVVNAEDISPNLQSEIANLVPQTALRRIGFVGSRGVGKTTLINRLLLGLGQDFLPTDPGDTSTATITEISAWPKECGREDYGILIFFIEEGEWKEFVLAACNDLAAWRASQDFDADAEERDKVPSFNSLCLCVEAFATEMGFGVDLDIFTVKNTDGKYPFEVMVQSKEDSSLDLLPVEVRRLLAKGYEVISRRTVEETRETLKRYCSRQECMWPVVHKVSLRGPFPFLSENGISLVDIPGEGDSDPLMERYFRRGVDMCANIYYLPPIKQVGTLTTVNGIARFMSCPKVSVVVTHSHGLLKANPKEELDGTYRTKLIQNARKYGDVVIQYLNHIPMHFLDNDETHAHEFSDMWSQFLWSLTSVLDEESQKSVVEYVNDINEAFSLLRVSCDTADQERYRLRALIEHCIGVCEESKGLLSAAGYADELMFFEKPVYLIPGHVANHFVLNSYFNGGSNNLYPAQALLGQVRQFEQVMTSASTCMHVVVGNVRDRLLAIVGDTTPLNTVITYALQSTEVTTNVTADLYAYLVRAVYGEYSAEWNRDCFQPIGQGRVNRTKVNMENWLRINEIRILRFIRDSTWRYFIVHANNLLSGCSLRLRRAIDFIVQNLNEHDAQFIRSFHRIEVSEVLSGTLFTRDLPRPPPVLAPPRDTSALTILLELIASDDNNLLSAPNQATIGRLVSLRRRQEGSVYVMSNSAFHDSYFKIGLTTGMPWRRANQLYTTGVPLPFTVKQTWHVRDARLMESIMHMIFTTRRVNTNREFFEVPLQLIVVVGNAVATFVNSTFDVI